VIEKFIFEISMRDMNIGIRSLHLFQAWSEDEKAIYQVKATEFYEMLEATLVNQNLPRQHQTKAGAH